MGTANRSISESALDMKNINRDVASGQLKPPPITTSLSSNALPSLTKNTISNG